MYKFLLAQHDKGVETVDLFCDGCAGQNKNSIFPAMLQHFLSLSKCTKEVRLVILVPSHGHKENDSVHACIERALRRKTEIFHPAQLTALIENARKSGKAYLVHELSTHDILDWKQRSQAIGFLRARTSLNGKDINWTKIAQIKFNKETPSQMEFKNSHLDEYDILSLPDKRKNTNETNAPDPADTDLKKISSAKFNDLASLCQGTMPVVKHVDHQNFFLRLPH